VIPYGKQSISKEDIDRVTEVLNSDFLTQGPMVPMFEDRISSYVGSKFSSAFNSATSALHSACMSLGLSNGDILWTSAISFVASSNCGLYCGAEVDFVDINPRTFNICPKQLSKKLLLAKKNNCLPKVLIVVHMCGQSSDMKYIYEICKRYSIKIIEDASHAIGGTYQNSKVGSCKYSDITIFSFHPVKIITTAEGGIACTNSAELKYKLDLTRSHGITKDKEKLHSDLDENWFYEQHTLGYNYRMTDMAAALGISQLERVDDFVQKRNKLALKYDDLLSESPLLLPQVIDESYSSFHLYVILIDESKTDVKRIELYNHLFFDKKIGVNVHYIPIYKHPYYMALDKNFDEQVNSENYYKRALSIPMYPGLNDEELVYISDSIKEFF
jgi:UDP-4-amino-4,6-dideoxy-N-acetyl-beta-L-altrosamine transaminase